MAERIESGAESVERWTVTTQAPGDRRDDLEPLSSLIPFGFRSESPVVYRPTLLEDATPEILWKALADRLQGNTEEGLFKAWFAGLKPVSIESSKENAILVLATGNKFAAEHLSANYGAMLTEIGKNLVQEREFSVKFVVHPTKSGGPAVISRPAKRQRTQQSDGSNLNPKYTFSNFVVGSCNQLAHAVSVQVAENLGAKYNPLFIYGGVGLGKTHLVNAIGNATCKKGKKALMISSEAFVNELIASLRSNRMQQFKSKFRSLDLLIVDDVQFIMGKERTQEEFFHTFNDLYQRHKQIIVTSDKLPHELTGLEERLRNYVSLPVFLRIFKRPITRHELP